VSAQPADGPARSRTLSVAATTALVLLALAVYPAHALPRRAEVTPERAQFMSFPMTLGAWQGHRQAMERIYLDILKLDDYVLANYVQPQRPPVNFYVAYYASQRTGVSAHSPAACLPGGGWQIQSFSRKELAGLGPKGAPLVVNRALIQQGDVRQLVYYWFQQRGRDVTNEYLVKWYLFWDSLTRSRTDGALVRIMTPLPATESAQAADARLAEFTEEALPKLTRFVPD
jgi:EpsI family protein